MMCPKRQIRLLSLAMLALMFACANEEDRTATKNAKASPAVSRKKPPEGTATTPGKAKLQASPAGAQANNLVPDPEFARLDAEWQLVYSDAAQVRRSALETVTLPNGQTVKALRVTTDDGCRITQKNPIPADPNKTYRFSLWVKQDSPSQGFRYLGLFLYGPKREILQAATRDGKPEPNPYFWVGNVPPGQWRQFTGYLLPSPESPEGTRLDLPVSRGFLSSPAMRSCAIRFLNYYNKGQNVSAWFALPRIEEVPAQPAQGAPTMRPPASRPASRSTTAPAAPAER